jgi:prepilin-type processing-associated H-X9-DG protein
MLGHTGKNTRPRDGEPVCVEAHSHHIVHIILQEANKDVNTHGSDHSNAAVQDIPHTDHVTIVFIDGHVGSRIVRSSTYICTRTFRGIYERDQRI